MISADEQPLLFCVEDMAWWSNTPPPRPKHTIETSSFAELPWLGHTTILIKHIMTATRKEKHAEHNKCWRAKKKAEAILITNELNAKRAELNLPPVSWELKHSCPFKGGKRPGYKPPKEQRALMTKQQLSQWQCEARKQRKAIKQRENRIRKKVMLDQMKKELVELNRRLEKKKRKTEDRTSDDTVTAPIQGIEQVKNSRRKEDILVADPFIENDVDAAASWLDDDETLASADEIANVFDM
jgi:hypothetical protein